MEAADKTGQKPPGPLQGAIITIIALAFVALHMARPSLPFDTATLVLLVIAVIPWLVHYVRKFEFGDGKLAFEINNAIEQTKDIGAELAEQRKQIDNILPDAAAGRPLDVAAAMPAPPGKGPAETRAPSKVADLIAQAIQARDVLNELRNVLERQGQLRSRFRSLLQDGMRLVPGRAAEIQNAITALDDSDLDAETKKVTEFRAEADRLIGALSSIGGDESKVPAEIPTLVSNLTQGAYQMLDVVRRSNGEMEKRIQTWNSLIAGR